MEKSYRHNICLLVISSAGTAGPGTFAVGTNSRQSFSMATLVFNSSMDKVIVNSMSKRARYELGFTSCELSVTITHE